jgi:hypothetical protein
MLARLMRRHIWPVSLLVGLGLITAACGPSTPSRGVTSPTLTPSPSLTATISPTTTATSVAIAGCRFGSPNMPFVNPPGPLLPTIPVPPPLPPGTLIAQSGLGIQAGSVQYTLCTPGATPATITAFMDSALPAAGWTGHSVPACNAASYDWYKGQYGMDIEVAGFSPPDVWALDMCPHVGQD